LLFVCVDVYEAVCEFQCGGADYRNTEHQSPGTYRDQPATATTESNVPARSAFGYGIGPKATP